MVPVIDPLLPVPQAPLAIVGVPKVETIWPEKVFDDPLNVFTPFNSGIVPPLVPVAANAPVPSAPPAPLDVIAEPEPTVMLVPKYPARGLVAPAAPMSYVLSVNSSAPVSVPPVSARSRLEWPVSEAVIVPAEKFPEASRATSVLTVFAVATPVPVGRPLMTGVASVGVVPRT